MRIKNNDTIMNMNNNNIEKINKENNINIIKNNTEIKKPIKLFYWNFRSIKNLAKKTICKEKNPQVIVLTEPWEKWESIHF